ncbi:CPBP family intramembrane glutamic endopeptidase [Arthrobacter sp. MMS18-M83]|uniref:CPBP family intramembrane glutamic endopeptidase n=1 Tax=Arthrobacter sp. MMS18-M83 TaxID=2996261 RepID=UPI00227B8048|nr:type II CAAX endopeptidase family protein [Arthrobacter sp. MMS18-M83]WAH98279.1 type II CAAX endopeptidase family protein [Arthrobacter sp. MMS18-M83]
MLLASTRRLRAEVLIVLGLSLGQSAVYSVVQLLDKMTRAPLSQATSTLNRSQNTREYFDLTYQLLDIAFALVPVVLVFYFLSIHRQTAESASGFTRLGFNFARPGRDGLQGLGLAALIGIPSLGLYAAGRALGITTAIIPSGLDSYWWTVPVLVLSAVRHAVVEEVIVVGYLLDRFGKFGWSTPLAIGLSAILRGSYHLYQGFGPFIGNAVMGLVFGWIYTRTKRVMPLVVAHALLDIVAFVGFSIFGKAIGLG